MLILIRISAVIMPDLENISIAVRISLVSCIQAEIYVIPYSHPVTGRHI